MLGFDWVFIALAFLLGTGLGWGSMWVFQRDRREQQIRLLTQTHQMTLSSAHSKIEHLEASILEGQHRLQTTRSEVETLRQDLITARETNTELRTMLKAAQQHAEEKLVLLKDARKELSDTFKALSSDSLQHNNKTFIELAKATLGQFQEAAKGDLEGRQKAIDHLVKPLKDSLEKVDLKIQEIEKNREKAYGSLTEHLGFLKSAVENQQQQTTTLVQALKSPTVRGRWGEIQLKRVVELAGMVEYCDFQQQTSTETETGRLRPDMVIKLPNLKNVVVDAKTPLQGYLEALEAPSEDIRLLKLQDHARHVRSHLMDLGRKQYWDQFKPTPEFVVLFLPGETFFSAALEQDPSLIEFGVEQRVILATPTTLIALLRSIAYGWSHEKLAQNAEAISLLGAQLYERLCSVSEHFESLGKGLDKAIKSYNTAVGSMESRVLKPARRFKELSVSTKKDIPELQPVDTIARDFQAVEFTSPASLLENDTETPLFVTID